MKNLIFIFLILFISNLNGSALDNIYLNADDAVIKNYGAFQNSSSFYINPALLNYIEKSKIILGDSFSKGADDISFNSFNLAICTKLSKAINIGGFFQKFIDQSQDNFNYSESKFGFALGIKLFSLKLGALGEYNKIGIDYNNSSMKDFKINFGLNYELLNYNLVLGYVYKNYQHQQAGLAYKFNELNSIGVNFENYYNNFNISLSGFASIIGDKLMLNFGISPIEYSAGIKYKIPLKIKKFDFILNYGMVYNLYLLDRHYVNLEINL
jgi:hypothetical protein